MAVNLLKLFKPLMANIRFSFYAIYRNDRTLQSTDYRVTLTAHFNGTSEKLVVKKGELSDNLSHIWVHGPPQKVVLDVELGSNKYTMNVTEDRRVPHKSGFYIVLNGVREPADPAVPAGSTSTEGTAGGQSQPAAPIKWVVTIRLEYEPPQELQTVEFSLIGRLLSRIWVLAPIKQ